jgi:hypothetical protein
MAVKILQEKGMRDVRALINSGSDVEKVSNFNFRSPEEVVFFLKKLVDTVKLDDEKLKEYEKLYSGMAFPEFSHVRIEKAADAFRVTRTGAPTTLRPSPIDLKSPAVQVTDDIKVTNIKKIKDSFDVIRSLQDKLEILDTIEVQIQHMFRNERTPLTKSVKESKDKVQKSLDTALKFLNKTATRKVPKAFSEHVNAIIDLVLKRLDKQYRNVKETTYLTLEEENQTGADFFVFHTYFRFQDLDNGDGYIYPEYYIVFTAVIDPKMRMRMYVNTMHKFRPPGQFKYGHSFTDRKSGSRELEALLDVDELVDALEPQKVPVGDTGIDVGKFSAKQFITNVEVVDDVIRISFNRKVNKKNVKEVTIKVFQDIRGLMSTRSKSQVKYKIAQNSNNAFVAEFKLTLPPSEQMREKMLDATKIKILKEKFSFDDADIRNLMKMLHREK